jgi:photosystem II stability/assembly factor-like uncharacterized protein
VGANRSRVIYRHTVVALPPPPVHAASFTAVSERDYWVLATARGRFTILRTTNGGRSFVRLSAPPLPLSGITPFLRFADRRDGFAFVPGVGGRFYATHDGGRTWTRVARGTLLAFATGGGNVYIVTAGCTPKRCSAYRFERASVAGGAWSSQPLPFAPAASILRLAAHGSSVWLLGSAVGDRQHDSLARSVDGGRTFAVGAGPCYGDLGGDLEPSSASVVWAICPTGLMAGAWRSTNGGVSFAPLKTRGLVNSAALAPASDTTAVLAANGAGAPLLRTTNGGASWRPVTPKAGGYDYWLGFTDAKVGVAIGSNGILWRTTDSGASWSRVRLDIRPG